MTIIDALSSPVLFGALPAFRNLVSWRPWLVLLRAVYGLEMNPADLDVFRKHTGRSTPRPGGYPEAVAIVGRQSGKSAIAATVAAFEAATSRQRGTFALLVAQDERGVKRTLFSYAREPFRSVPVFAREVERETADTVELSSGASLGCYPCRPAAVRGVRASVVAVDELAYFTATDGRPTDREMLRAIRPTLATTGGKLLILSSPYGQSGALWDLHRQHHGREDSPVLIWQASAPEMNPTLAPDYLARMEQDDPEAYRSEVLGEFRAGIASLFDAEALDACVARGVREVPPVPGTSYRAHYDASGGRSDAAAISIGHREKALLRLDCVRRWPAPHNPETVIGEAADVLRAYGLPEVQIDRFGGDFPIRAFERAGIRAFVAEKATSDHYLSMLPRVNSASLVLLDLPDLLRELRGLERRRGSSGKDHVDHRGGAHDDAAAAVAGLVALLSARRGVSDLSTIGVGWRQANAGIAPGPTHTWGLGVSRLTPPKGRTGALRTHDPDLEDW